MAWTEKDEKRMNEDVNKELETERFITAILAGEKVEFEYSTNPLYVFHYDGTYGFASVWRNDWEYRSYDYTITYAMGFDTAEDAKKALAIYDDDMEAYYDAYEAHNEHVTHELGTDAFYNIAEYTKDLVMTLKMEKCRRISNDHYRDYYWRYGKHFTDKYCKVIDGIENHLYKVEKPGDYKAMIKEGMDWLKNHGLMYDFMRYENDFEKIA